MVNIMYRYLLTEWVGRAGKYLAQGQDIQTKRSEVCVSINYNHNLIPQSLLLLLLYIVCVLYKFVPIILFIIMLLDPKDGHNGYIEISKICAPILASKRSKHHEKLLSCYILTIKELQQDRRY